MIKSSMKVVSALALVAMVSGCAVTAYGPSADSVTFEQGAHSVETNETLSNSVEVREVDGFVGTNRFAYSGRTASNMTNKTFREALERSLANTNYLGQGYVLDIELLESNDWSNWSAAMGTRDRNILVNMTLTDSQGNILIDKEVEGEGDMTNYNILAPFHVLDRQAATISYSDLIKKIIQELNDF
jgi:hypothetical protein